MTDKDKAKGWKEDDKAWDETKWVRGYLVEFLIPLRRAIERSRSDALGTGRGSWSKKDSWMAEGSEELYHLLGLIMDEISYEHRPEGAYLVGLLGSLEIE